MKNIKKFFMSIIALTAIALTSCRDGGNILSEQYFEQPTISDKSTITVELLHKTENKWLDVLKQKATSVGLTVRGFDLSSKGVKKELDVPLRRSNVYNKEDEIKSDVADLIDNYNLEYLKSDFYTVPEEETESPEETATKKFVETTDTTEPEPAEVVDPLFPISYGTKDALAAKFALNLGKVIDELKLENMPLFSLKISLEKYGSEIGILGISTYVVSYIDNAIEYGIPVSLVFNGKSVITYLVKGKTAAFSAPCCNLLQEMLKADAKFAINYDDAENTTEIDLEKTIFVDEADETNVPEGAFNIHGKENLVIKIKEK